MITQPKTFGVLDRVDISDVHVIGLKAAPHWATCPESSTPAWASGTLPSAISGRLRPHTRSIPASRRTPQPAERRPHRTEKTGSFTR